VDPDIKDIMTRCAASTGFHGKYFFPEIFYSEYSILHRQILKAIDSNHRKVVIAAPRGLGKTSTMLYGLASRHILFEKKRFIIYLSNSADNAMIQTDSLKHELLSNHMIRKFFGSVKTSRVEMDYEEQFSKKAWVTSGGTLILPRGAGQQVRGLLYHGHRPDLIIIDDLEDKAEIKNENIRKKNKEWFYSDVMKCISRYDNDYQFVYIDTLKHEDALLQDLLDADDWYSLIQSVCDDDYNTYAPQFMSTEEIKAEVEEHKKKGILDVFYREMRNIPVATETASFKQEFFHYYTEGIKQLTLYPDNDDNKKVEKIETGDLLNVVIIDPAKEPQLHNADTAIVGIGIDRSSKKILIRDIVSTKLYPDQMYKEAFQMIARLKAMILAVEVTSLHQFISQPIENEMRVQNCFAQYHELKAVASKEERIGFLVPYYRQGYIYHNKVCCNKLESQLVGFPRSKLWDVMDAVAYIVKLLDDFSFYFDPTYNDPDEDEFLELSYDKPLNYQRVA
jgi:hypothetical protein